VRLISAQIHGFRRFADQQKLYLDRRLVCLVGANEVGKSSTLLALKWATLPDAALDQSDHSRGQGVPDDRCIVELEFRLDSNDKAVIRDLGLQGEAAKAHKFVMRKYANGVIKCALDTKMRRDRRPRASVARKLEKAAGDEHWLPETEAAETAATPARLSALQEQLAKDQESLDGHYIEELRDLAGALRRAEIQPNLAQTLEELAAHEEAPHPTTEAKTRLLERVPEFASFDAETRELEAEYDLASVASAPPPALKNLATLAGLDLAELYGTITRDQSGSAQTMRDKANSVLNREFLAWSQKPRIEVAFDHTDELLRLHVKSGEGHLMKINERSDGLKQFVALIALIGGTHRPIKPILLIDEAERHLHMDAQADLMQVLARQNAAEQVIYTTHSPACLPENIGSSVRVLHGVDDRTESRIRNHFWTDEPGYGPMLLAMGASSLAFVPLRPALIVEGGSDLVLLGDLVCEAIKREQLGYQIIPGSSNARPTQIAGLDLQGTETVWLFDGDDSGKKKRQTLLDHSIPAKRALLRAGTDGQGLDLEDLVHPEAYAKAVTSYAKDVNSDEIFGVGALPANTCSRHKTVVGWCQDVGIKPPSKTAVANKVLDLREQGDPILDPDKRTIVSGLHKATRKGLGL
jgi:predicted ATP-dependent endonuclease of OLD family